jgi:hypothetical protein
VCTFPHLARFFQVFRPPPLLRDFWIESGWVDHRMLPSLFRSLRGLRKAVVDGASIPDPYFAGFIGRKGRGGAFVFERAR